MDLLTILFLAVGLAVDAFAVSVACGLAFERREHLRATTIAGSFGVFQAVMPVVGWLAGLGLRRLIEGVDHWVAFGLLTLIGGRMIVEAVRVHAEQRPLSPPGNLRLLALSVATSIDALAVGLTLAVLRIPIVRPIVVIGVVTFAVSYLGIVLGHELENVLRGRLKRDIQIVGGLVLIAIGLRILVSHLTGG
jgi:putative Mn2+ efflux pump MntP